MHDKRYVKPERTVEMDGSSGPLAVTIAGYTYLFRVLHKSDCAFEVVEYQPDGEAVELSGGSEW